MYTVYHGTANDENWNNIENVTDVSRRQYILKVAMGNEYKVLITATNKYGESSKKGKVLVDVQGGEFSVILTDCLLRRSRKNWPGVSFSLLCGFVFLSDRYSSFLDEKVAQCMIVQR